MVVDEKCRVQSCKGDYGHAYGWPCEYVIATIKAEATLMQLSVWLVNVVLD